MSKMYKKLSSKNAPDKGCLQFNSSINNENIITYQDNIIALEMQKLNNLGIDITKDDYYKKPKFLSLKKTYIVEKGASVTEAWWIEKYIVGQERLGKIYGRYAFGITASLSETELKESTLFSVLANKYPEKCRNESDIYKYFHRNERSEKNGTKLGLIERLKKWGFDIEAFSDAKARVKLLYFLYCFEVENKVMLSAFLENPTLENVDNGFVADITKNGDIMAEIKRNIAKEIDSLYIFRLNNTFVTIVHEWEEQIRKVMFDLDTSEDRKMYKDLERINKFSRIVVQMLESPKHRIYKDSLLETFYLKLAQHETLGRENDIIDITEQIMDTDDKEITYRPEEYKKLASETVRKDCVQSYVNENRKYLAHLVFEKDKISSNEYKKFDTAVEKIEFFLDMLNENTEVNNFVEIPKLLIVAYIQEIVMLDKTDVISNKFYRHQKSDEKTLNSELNYGTAAYRKNQLAWIGRVNNRYNIYKGLHKEILLARQIENKIDQIMIKIFSCNSLDDMVYLHNYLMMWFDAILVDGKRIKQEIKLFEKAIGRKKKGLSRCRK